MKKVFIAGHSGLVGQAFLAHFSTDKSVDLVTKTHEELDLTQQLPVASFFKCEKPDCVIIAAGKVGGIKANLEAPAQYIYENTMIAANIIHQSWINGVEDLLFFGSTCMYPRYCPQPMREDSLLSGPLEPSNESYALAKLAGWKLVESYNLQYGMKFRTVIPANLYGPNDNFDPYEGHVIPALIQKIHNAKEEKSGEITVWGSGEARRDFLFVDDLVEAFDFLEQHPKVLGPINIGTPREVSIRQLVDLLREVIDFSGAIHFDHSKPDGMPFKKVDTHQLDKLGWRSGTSLRDGLEKTYEWFLYSKQNSRA